MVALFHAIPDLSLTKLQLSNHEELSSRLKKKKTTLFENYA